MILFVGLLWLFFAFANWVGWAHAKKYYFADKREDTKEVAKIFFIGGAALVAVGIYGIRNSGD